MARQDAEQDLVKVITRFLRSKGCIVTMPEKPTVIFLHEGFWGAIEVKKTKSSPFRPGQKEMVTKLDEWSYARVVWGGKNSNWSEVRKEIEELLR